MGNFAHRVTDTLLRSEFLPVKARMRLMRRIGYDFHPSACLWAGAILRSKNITIGPNSFINVGFFFDGHEHLEIAGNVRIGQFVRVITATHEIGPPWQRCTLDVVGGPVHIGAGSWIGCNVSAPARGSISASNPKRSKRRSHGMPSPARRSPPARRCSSSGARRRRCADCKVPRRCRRAIRSRARCRLRRNMRA